MFLYFERDLREILARPGEPLVHAVGSAVRATWGNDGNLIGLVFTHEEFEREQERSHGQTFHHDCQTFHGVEFHVCDCRAFYVHDPADHHGEFVYREARRKMLRNLPPMRFLTGRGGGKSWMASMMRYENGRLTIDPIGEYYAADPFADPDRNRQGGEAIMDRARRDYELARQTRIRQEMIDRAVEGHHPRLVLSEADQAALRRQASDFLNRPSILSEALNGKEKPKRPPSKLHPLVQLDEELRRLGGEAPDPIIEPGHP